MHCGLIHGSKTCLHMCMKLPLSGSHQVLKHRLHLPFLSVSLSPGNWWLVRNPRCLTYALCYKTKCNLLVKAWFSLATWGIGFECLVSSALHLRLSSDFRLTSMEFISLVYSHLGCSWRRGLGGMKSRWYITARSRKEISKSWSKAGPFRKQGRVQSRNTEEGDSVGYGKDNGRA